jgi:hypothetical protein
VVLAVLRASAGLQGLVGLRDLADLQGLVDLVGHSRDLVGREREDLRVRLSRGVRGRVVSLALDSVSLVPVSVNRELVVREQVVRELVSSLNSYDPIGLGL